MNLADWKLKLRYGKTKTPFKHYTLLADSVIGDLSEGFSCPTDNAVVAMKIWALDSDQAVQVFQEIGGQIGFKVKDKIEIYDTPATKPPTNNPFAYDINFTPYNNSYQ